MNVFARCTEPSFSDDGQQNEEKQDAKRLRTDVVWAVVFAPTATENVYRLFLENDRYDCETEFVDLRHAVNSATKDRGFFAAQFLFIYKANPFQEDIKQIYENRVATFVPGTERVTIINDEKIDDAHRQQGNPYYVLASPLRMQQTPMDIALPDSQAKATKLCAAVIQLFPDLNTQPNPGDLVDVNADALRFVFDVQAPDNESLLYRHCYKEIFEIFSSHAGEFQAGATGTPGIGKSTMLFFMTLLFLQANKTVVLATRPTRPNYLLICRAAGSSVEATLITELPTDQSYVYLLDVPDPAKERALYYGLAIWVHSPGAERTGKEYYKRMLVDYYVPLWSNAEVSKVWAKISGKNLPNRPQSEEELFKNKAMCGGVARAIFVPHEICLSKMNKLLERLHSIKPEERYQMLRNVGTSGINPEWIVVCFS